MCEAYSSFRSGWGVVLSSLPRQQKEEVLQKSRTLPREPVSHRRLFQAGQTNSRFYQVQFPENDDAKEYRLRTFFIVEASVMTPAVPRTKGRLKCYSPSTDIEKIKLQHVALASAMSQQGIEYSNELVYRKGCPASMNRVKYDEQRHLLKEMSKSDRIVYDATIKLNKEGFMAPVMVQEDDIQGYRCGAVVPIRFIVVADEVIKEDTLITEYIGEVDILSKNEQNSNDSIMDLLDSG